MKEIIKRLDLMLDMVENYSYEADPEPEYTFVTGAGYTSRTPTIRF